MFEIYLTETRRRQTEEEAVKKVESWLFHVSHPNTPTNGDVCSPCPCPDPLTCKALLKLLLHTHPNSDELHLHLKFSFVPFPAEGGEAGGSWNHRGDRDSAFVSSEPLSENLLWPPWPSGCGVCVRAGNHCMMTMPYVIRHKLTLCLSSSTGCLCAQRSTARRLFEAAVTSVLMKDLHCSPDTFWKLLRNDLALSLRSFSYENMLQLSQKQQHFQPADLLIHHVCCTDVIFAHRWLLHVSMWVFAKFDPCLLTLVLTCLCSGAPACWIPTGWTSMEIRGLEHSPQNTALHVWPDLCSPSHTLLTLMCVTAAVCLKQKKLMLLGFFCSRHLQQHQV